MQTTLEKAYVNWSRIGRMECAEAYVRRMLATTLAGGEPGSASSRGRRHPLRAALTQEADMQDAPRPDVDRLISGGRGRRRRRNLPVVPGATSGGLGVYRPLALADGSGCNGDAPSVDVAGTAQALARQLARLPRSTVVLAPTPGQAFGHDAVHLRLRIDDDCPQGQGYRVAETLRGSRGISYSDVPREVVIDFWVVDVDGLAVVVDTWHQDGASSQRVDQIARTRDTITCVTGE